MRRIFICCCFLTRTAHLEEASSWHEEWLCTGLQERITDYVNSVDEYEIPKQKAKFAEWVICGWTVWTNSFPFLDLWLWYFSPLISKSAHWWKYQKWMIFFTLVVMVNFPTLEQNAWDNQVIGRKNDLTSFWLYLSNRLLPLNTNRLTTKTSAYEPLGSV